MFFYNKRVNTCSIIFNFIQFEIAVITEDGVTVESNMTADTNWDIAHYVK